MISSAFPRDSLVHEFTNQINKIKMTVFSTLSFKNHCSYENRNAPRLLYVNKHYNAKSLGL